MGKYFEGKMSFDYLLFIFFDTKPKDHPLVYILSKMDYHTLGVVSPCLKPVLTKTTA